MLLSRILIPFSFVALAMPGASYARATPEEAIEQASARLGIRDTECESNGRQIVVCARQNDNDRYRLPFNTAVPGDPANEGVWEERARLQAAPGTCQSASYFQVGCGSVGISFGVGGSNSGFRTGGLRRVGQ